ncbi:MAG: hypothetical protein AB7T59_10560 [Hyphomonadaceae bacterium]
MDRERFDQLLEAYGADFRRWPADARGAAVAFAAQHPETASLLEEARGLDRALDASLGDVAPSPDLTARILARAPRRARTFDRRALLALAACAAFGMVLGFGGGLLAPAPIEDESFFSMAFEAPFALEDEG